MRYIELSGFGPPEVMRIGEAPLPACGEGDVLIRVEFAGVNRPDLVQRAGNYAPLPGSSTVLGLEVAGRIEAVGAAVTQWRSGDAVCALVPGGGYAEYCVAPAAHCLPVPKGLSVLEAASLPENYFTVWVNVFEGCRLAAGESFLVHGGSSGIGLAAIQLAKAFGARVFTTAGSEEKVQACMRMGADLAVNYRERDFVEAVAAEVGKRGVDVILDMVGGSYIPRNLKLLATEGRLCFIAFLEGSKAEIDFMRVMLKRQVLTGSTLRARPDAQKAAIAEALRRRVWPLFEAGTLKPAIFEVFPLHEAARAHRLMESSRHIGKIMLEI
jgi:NADPH2:quinone reductase